MPPWDDSAAAAASALSAGAGATGPDAALPPPEETAARVVDTLHARGDGVGVVLQHAKTWFEMEGGGRMVSDSILMCGASL